MKKEKNTQDLRTPEAIELAISELEKAVKDFGKSVTGINKGLKKLKKKGHDEEKGTVSL